MTDRIDTFTERGIGLESGRELEADITVTATGLTLLAFGGITFTVNGEPANLSDKVAAGSCSGRNTGWNEGVGGQVLQAHDQRERAGVLGGVAAW